MIYNQITNITERIRNKPVVLLELPTGYGKTKLAIDYLNNHNCKRPLIVTPTKVIENGWITDQVPRWNKDPDMRPKYIQYASFAKSYNLDYVDFDAVVFDEGHHITERCKNTIFSHISKFDDLPTIILSATVNNEKRTLLDTIYKDIYTVKIDTPQAILEEKLPIPKIIFMPITLSFNAAIEYSEMQERFNTYKSKLEISNNMWDSIKLRRLAKDMYVFLSNEKERVTKALLYKLRNKRTLTFCANIPQAERLGKHTIHSRNGKLGMTTLNKFNKKKIKHITSVAMLNEGVNLTSCQIGIFNYLSPTKKINVQQIGRILRHKNPILIIPYVLNTRDAMIANKLYAQYHDVAEIHKIDPTNIINEYEGKYYRTRKTSKKVRTSKV